MMMSSARAQIKGEASEARGGRGGALLLRAGEGISAANAQTLAAFVLHQVDQTRHIWSWLATAQRAAGPFGPPPVSRGANRADCFPVAVGVTKLQTSPPVFAVHVRTARKI